MDGIRYGTGTVIERMAHKHLGHPGRFEDCRRCHACEWLPDNDFGILVYVPGRRLAEESETVRQLLVP